MATDNSLFSQIEDWIVSGLQLLESDGTPLFSATDRKHAVAYWNGSDKQVTDAVLNEFMNQGRNIVIRVYHDRNLPFELESGAVAIESYYAVIVCAKSNRQGGSRRGDDVQKIGTNLMQEVIIKKLHDQRPPGNSNDWYPERMRWMGSGPLKHGKDATAVRMDFSCRLIC